MFTTSKMCEIFFIRRILTTLKHQLTDFLFIQELQQFAPKCVCVNILFFGFRNLAKYNFAFTLT